MINYIWAGMLIIGFVVGAATGNLEAVTKAAIDNAQSAFELSLGLVGVMKLVARLDENCRGIRHCREASPSSNLSP